MNLKKIMTLGVLLGVLGLGSSVNADTSAKDVPPGKVWAYWSFDAVDIEGNQVRDRGPLGLHATIEGEEGAIQSTDAVRGQGLHFQNNKQGGLTLPRNQNFGIKPPFTLAAWVKPQSRRASMDIFCQKAESWREGVRWVFSPRRLFFEYSEGRGNIQVRYDQHQTQIDQWAFIAVVHDGSHISLYVDGACVKREAAKPMIPTTRQAFIGNYILDKKTYAFVGVLDELIVLREALSDDKLVELGQWTLQKRSHQP
jgi:hypothetical protein